MGKLLCTVPKVNKIDHVVSNESVKYKIPPKKSSESNYSLPVISVTCEGQVKEQSTICDKHSEVVISVEPPSPNRRAKSVPGVLLSGTYRYFFSNGRYICQNVQVRVFMNNKITHSF